MQLAPLRSAAEHRRVNTALARLLRDAGARRARIRLQEGTLPALHLERHELWMVQHELENRYRNAFGPGAPTKRLVWPSVQLNLAFEPGSARPQARFLRDRSGQWWLAHTGTLGGRQTGISREGFLTFAGDARDVEIAGRTERLLVLGTFSRPAALVDAIAHLVHAAHAYRSAIAAGLR